METLLYSRAVCSINIFKITVQYRTKATGLLLARPLEMWEANEELSSNNHKDMSYSKCYKTKVNKKVEKKDSSPMREQQ